MEITNLDRIQITLSRELFLKLRSRGGAAVAEAVQGVGR